MRSRVGAEGEAQRNGLRRAERPPSRRSRKASMTSPLGQTLTLMAYYAVLAALAVYGAHRGLMVHLYYRHRKESPRPVGALAALPPVTVQLPIYNEFYVVERLVEAVAAIDYPRELLQIQILDDSDDETLDVSRAMAARLAARGFRISHCPRPDRQGF